LFPDGRSDERPFFLLAHPGIQGKVAMILLLFSLSSFACPKEETRKRHPSQSWPCGLPLLLDEGGTRKNSGFALRQFPRLFRPRLRGAAGQMGGRKKFPLARSRAPERLPKRGFALFEAQPSLQSPGSIEEHRESRLRRDKCLGALSLVRFFGQAKK
jgi:hypothetical protein